MLVALRFAARLLWKDRGFAATAIITLAVCIGANAAIFAVVNSVLLQPLPVPHAEQLLHMSNEYPGAGALQHARRDAQRQRRRGRAHTFHVGHAVAAAPPAGAADPRPPVQRE